MTQGQEVEAAEKLPTLTEIIGAWNTVTDNIKPLTLYLAKENVLTLEDVGGVADALEVISNVLRANLKLHNESVLVESNRRTDAEKGIRAKLEQKRAEKDAGDAGEVVKTVKVNSKDNDAPEPPETDPALNKTARPAKEPIVTEEKTD